MGTTTYYATTAHEQLAAAQQMLDAHVTSGADGLCRACGLPGPCPRRETAVVIFSHSHRLPRRQPGATKPDLIGIASGGGSWFRAG
jgi:hypothetical protein